MVKPELEMVLVRICVDEWRQRLHMLGVLDGGIACNERLEGQDLCVDPVGRIELKGSEVHVEEM